MKASDFGDTGLPVYIDFGAIDALLPFFTEQNLESRVLSLFDIPGAFK
jgi:hypothetical protein